MEGTTRHTPYSYTTPQTYNTFNSPPRAMFGACSFNSKGRHLQYSAQAAQPIKHQNRPRSSHPQPHIAPSFIVNRVNPISFVQLLRTPRSASRPEDI
jgi:hypothetical protein